MIYFKLAPYAAIAILVGYSWVQGARIDAGQAENKRLTAELASCDARIDNISEDGRSDAKIDAKTNDDLSIVPSRWLFNAP